MSENSFFKAFETLKDPRSPQGRMYPLMDVIILTIYGILCGRFYFTHISRYLKMRDEKSNYQLTKMFHLAHGVPSHDVFSDVFRRLDKEEFMDCFVEWVTGIVYALNGTHIAIDGKAIRAATEKAKNGNIPYILSAFLCDACGISIGQIEIGEKKNEISEIPRLVDLINVKGKMVTIDAIGTQTKIMAKIVGKSGDFCSQVKNNHPQAYKDIKELFDFALEEKRVSDLANRPYEALDYHRTAEKDHGRYEVREYYTFNDDETVRDAIDPKWKHVHAVGMAVLERTILGENESPSLEVHFHMLSKPLSAKEYGKYARGHWAIENSLHWVLDVIFGEDRCTSNADNSILNIATIKKVAYNLLKLSPEEAGVTTQERMDYWTFSPDLFYKMLVDPASIMNIPQAA